MIYLGIAIMIYNVWQYIHFARRIRRRGDWEAEGRILIIPIFLLVLFLLGYIAVALSGKADLIVSAILFGGSIFVAVMDHLIERIADRIRENERLEARITAAEEANAAKTYFLSNMSHDIRTPLNAIIGYTAIAKTVPAGEQAAYLTKIENAGNQMLTLVNEVLEMSRIESGKMELEPANADLVSVVTQAGDLIRSQMEAKQIRFQVRTDIRDRWVVCDANRVSRIIMNILGNAQKFTPEGGSVTLTAEETGTDGTSASYSISIRDSGIGMSPEFVKNIFKPFERERTSTVSRTQGTGLGMSICKSFIDMMHGTIDVKTAPGEGSEFTVSLTFPLGEEQETAADRTADPARTANCGRRLLLAEDNEINTEIAKMLLSQAGYCVDAVENGQKAVEKLAAEGPGVYDAVLMDIQMPVMDGYTAAGQIRRLADPALAGIPIIAMTANAFREDELAAEAAGMQGHIAKPLNQEKMLKTIAEVLGK